MSGRTAAKRSRQDMPVADAPAVENAAMLLRPALQQGPVGRRGIQRCLRERRAEPARLPPAKARPRCPGPKSSCRSRRAGLAGRSGISAGRNAGAVGPRRPGAWFERTGSAAPGPPCDEFGTNRPRAPEQRSSRTRTRSSAIGPRRRLFRRHREWAPDPFAQRFGRVRLSIVARRCLSVVAGRRNAQPSVRSRIPAASSTTAGPASAVVSTENSAHGLASSPEDGA